jgi:hypothetical protein
MSDTPYRSLHGESWDEIDSHKWIPSECAGRDLGEVAIHQWVRDHWHGYLRSRWLEHLEGKCFWAELDRGDFGLLKREFRDGRDSNLLAVIVERLKNGEENLHIMLWAVDHQQPVEDVARILTAIDINSRRIVARISEDSEKQTAPPVAKSAALIRAERILAEGHRPDDILPIPHALRDAAERELGTRPVPPAEFWKNLLDATLRHQHAGQQLVTKRLPKGVIVLAVGRDEVAVFLGHFPADQRAGTAVEVV